MTLTRFQCFTVRSPIWT